MFWKISGRVQGTESGKQSNRQGCNWVYTTSFCISPAKVICLFTHPAWQAWIILSTFFHQQPFFTSVVDFQLNQKLTFCVTLSALSKTRAHLYSQLPTGFSWCLLSQPIYIDSFYTVCVAKRAISDNMQLYNMLIQILLFCKQFMWI